MSALRKCYPVCWEVGGHDLSFVRDIGSNLLEEVRFKGPHKEHSSVLRRVPDSLIQSMLGKLPVVGIGRDMLLKDQLALLVDLDHCRCWILSIAVFELILQKIDSFLEGLHVLVQLLALFGLVH